jgi:hypothetical protein
LKFIVLGFIFEVPQLSGQVLLNIDLVNVKKLEDDDAGEMTSEGLTFA